MIRPFLLSLWILCLTLGSVYTATKIPRSFARPDSAPGSKAAAPVTLKSMTVPVIANGAIEGYVLIQIAVLAKPELLSSLPQPAEIVLTDAAFKTIYAEEQIDFKHLQKQDLSSLSNKIVENINAKANAPLAEHVFIQELHYLSKQDAGAGIMFRH